MSGKRISDLALLRRILGEARLYWPYIAGIFFLNLLATPFSLLTPLPLKIAVDSVLGSDSLPVFLVTNVPSAWLVTKTNLLLFASGLVLLIAFLNQLHLMASSILQTYTGEKLTIHFSTLLFQHVQRLSLSYHDSKGISDSAYRIQYDTNALRYLAIDGVVPFISAILTLVSMLYITFLLDWQLALVALAISPILFIVARVYRGRLRHQARQVKRLESATFSVVQEVLTALRVVKAFGQEEYEQMRFEERANASLWARLRLTIADGSVGMLLSLTTALGTGLVLYLGVRHVQEGWLTLGELLLVISYLAQLYGPLQMISRKITSLQGHLASAERAFALLDQPRDVPDRLNGRTIHRSEGAISFQNVSFSYGNRRMALKDVSFSVTAGTRVGIAGRTGSGKTTLVSLLTRFYDPIEGQILLDDLNVCEYKLKDLRNQFAIVLQDPILFSTSIAENIAYGRLGASEEEIVQAARAANAHDFIVSLPDGYETQVGERGMRLSGGERQRVALARAFLKDAPVLIMDEPTSSVDVKTEAGIMVAMERLMQGRTSFMIAHRLSTLENCDVILEIENGHLVDVTSDALTTVREMLTVGQRVPAVCEVSKANA